MKRFIAGFIAFALLLSVFPISLLAQVEIDTTNYNSNALIQLEEDNNGVLEDQDRATFIVEIYGSEEKASNRSLYKARSARVQNDISEQAFIQSFKEAKEDNSLNTLVERRMAEQDEVLSQIMGKKVGGRDGFFSSIKNNFVSLFSTRDAAIVSRPLDLKNLIRYKAVLNGFALDLTYEEAKEIAQLDSVKNVYISRQYNRPEEAPLMKYSRQLVNSQVANDRGYDGKGRVVAILDTGIDLRHQDLKLSQEGLKAAKYNKASIEEKIGELQLWGKFGTDKVPYIYNYADRTFEMLDAANHGHHIAGTIAGNGDETNGGVVGIVPEAQILAMRVFAVGVPTTGTAIYAEAIDDAALLGADSINMSLGSYAGSVEGADLIMVKAIKRANDLGSIVAIAGGNDGFQMSNYDWQSSAMIDYATVGTPATMDESLAVASFNNNAYFEFPTTLSYNGKEAYINPGSAIDQALNTGFVLDKEYEFVEVGLGNTDADYAGKDVTGKIALAQRGRRNEKEDGSFNNKAQMAAKYGAIAIVIGNNAPEKGHFNMSMAPGLIPAYFVHLDTYDDLKTLKDKKLIILNKKGNILSTSSGTMSNFNSWGPTPALTIKPEIAAPGGDIRSIDNNGGYTYMSGTSMATPHVAGGIAAVNGKLQDLGMNLSGEDKTSFIKKILMSTARPQEVKDHPGKYYSVRSQGSGLMDLDAATNGNFVYLEDAGNRSSRGEAKIEFKQLAANSLPLSVNVISKADKDVSYDVYAVIQTDQVDENYKLNLNMAQYEPYTIAEKTKIGDITVPAMGSIKFNKTLNFDDSEFKDRFPYGYYVDGFVFFEPKNQEAAMADEHFSNISIPFLGFRGDWDSVPVIEPFIDELDASGNLPFWANYDFKNFDEYYSASPFDLHATSFMAQQNDIVNGSYRTNILGRTWGGNFTDNIAISPNKDNNQDDMTFKGVFLRNWSDFKIEITDDLGNRIKEIYIPYRSSGRKTAFTVNMSQASAKSTTNDFWTWDGSDQQGNIVPEGQYSFNVKVRRADDKNAKAQTLKKKVIVDMTKPRIENSRLDGDKIIVRAIDEGKVPSGIKDVFYIQNYVNDKNRKDIAVFKFAEENGQYVLDTREFTNIFNLDEGYLKVFDWAGNSVEENVAQVKGEASVEFIREFKDGSTEGLPTHAIDIYKVNTVDGEDSYELVEDQKALQDGRYIAEFRDIPTGYIYDWEPSNEFEINENNRHQLIKVKFEKVDKTGFANFTAKLVWPSDYPGQIKIIAIAEDGREYQLERTRGWGGILFNAQIPAGRYEIKMVDQYGNEVNVEGNKHIELKENDDWLESYQVVSYGAYIKVFLKAKFDIMKYLEEEDAFIPGKYGDGSAATLFKDLSKYLNITNQNTGTDLFETELVYWGEEAKHAFKTWNGMDKEGNYIVEMQIPAPFGDYTVEWKNVDDKVASPQSVESRTSAWGNNDKTWKGFFLTDMEGQVGNLTVKTGFVAGFEERNIDDLVNYRLVDSFGEIVEPSSDKTWNNLKVGNYTLYAESSEPGLIPERKSYSVVITDNVNEEITVRWKDQKDDPVERNGEIVIGIYGDGGSTIGLDKLTLIFKNLNKDNEKAKEFVYSIKNPEPMKILMPFGDYEVSVEGLYNYTIGSVFLSENDYAGTVPNGNKFKVGIYKAWNEIELSLTSKLVKEHDKDLYEPQATMIEKKVGDRVTEEEIYKAISIPGYSSHKEEPKFELLDYLREELLYVTTDSYKVKVIYPDQSYDIVYVSVKVSQDDIVIKPDDNYYPMPRPERPIIKEPVKDDKKDDTSKKEETKVEETKVEEKSDPLDIKDASLQVEFSDVKENKYHAEILDLSSRGILKGMDNGKFEPKTAITRAMLVETLMRISRDKSIVNMSEFPDVNEKDWFYKSVSWASERGIVIGNEFGQFEPNRVVTRQEVALIIARFLKSLGIELPQNADFDVNLLNNVPEWSRAEVEQMLKAGIVLALDENYVPTSEFLRDELAHALYSIINNRVK